MVEPKTLELLQFEKITALIRQKCFSQRARDLCDQINPQPYSDHIHEELLRTKELSAVLNGGGFFPAVEHEDISGELTYLEREGSLLHEEQLLMVLGTTSAINSLLRFLKSKKGLFPVFSGMYQNLDPVPEVENAINAILDHEGTVKDSASPDLQQIRRQIREKKKESDKRFYQYVAQLRKEGFLRENEEGFFNGRRTLAVLVEHKAQVPGFVHGKSESGKTIFIEPGTTMAVNNDIAELEIDERREVNAILRTLCAEIRPFAALLRSCLDFIVYTDFLKAKASLSLELNASLPVIENNFSLKIDDGYHPLLFLQNRKFAKPTIPLRLELNNEKRLLVISGPNAGGKTIALKTVGLLQLMLQSGLLIPVKESSRFSFFDKILVDIGDTQSIENELSTYSAKLKSMTKIMDEINEASLVLMDEFGSGTDPELGSAIAEAVLETLVISQTKGIITSHFGNVKLLADKLDGAINGSMLFDLEKLEPLYLLSVGEPGSSYTFEVAERIGFPKHLIERARGKVDKEKLRLNRLLAEVQTQKTKLVEEQERLEHEQFLQRMSKEKYNALFKKWEQKLHDERERKIELSRLADFGQKYLRLMNEWNEKKDRKEVIQRFIDGITAESKKQEILRKQNKLDQFAERKIARIKKSIKVGSKVRILNSKQVGVVEEIKEDKLLVSFGLMKMSVGMQNVALVEGSTSSS